MSHDSPSTMTRLRSHTAYPRENEVRVLERDGRRWLQQWRIPPGGQHRTWVEVGEIPKQYARDRAGASKPHVPARVLSPSF
jgi:hypothetical protein